MNSGPPLSSGFDRVARAYLWMEYLSFGPMLARCRQHFLPNIGSAHHALVIGDGDGRFCARLLLNSPQLTADAVDSSPVMLHALRQRCVRARVDHRLTTHPMDATKALPLPPAQDGYDLVATHFFLDCLSSERVSDLVRRVHRQMRPGAMWVVSEFALPPGPLLRLPARLLIRSMYLAFRVLTGLRVQHLPEHAAAFAANGFSLQHRQRFLGGLLIAELWCAPITPALVASDSTDANAVS